MEQYINKDTLVARIKKLKMDIGNIFNEYDDGFWEGRTTAFDDVICALDTLEVKEVGISIPNIDDLLEEDDINPYSKDAKLFKECYYMALERYKEKKGIV